MSQPINGDKPGEATSISVMLIDDDREFVDKLRYMVEGCGFVCRACSDPGEALESIGQNHFDVIVTDYQMPGINGAEVIEHVRKNSPDSKVIVVSGCLDSRTEREVKRVGASLCLTKPLHFSTLLDALNDVNPSRGNDDGNGS